MFAIVSVLAQLSLDANVQAIGGLVVGGGFSVWYGVHVTKVTLPKIVSDSKKELTLATKGFSETVQAITEAHCEALRDLSATNLATMTRIADHCEIEIGKVDARWERFLTERTR